LAQSGPEVTEEQKTAFLKRADEIAQLLRDAASNDTHVQVISHNDTDGLSSAGIVCMILHRLKLRFRLRIVEELTLENIREIAADQYDLFVFSDIGSGYANLINKYVTVPAIILDHHESDGTPNANFTQLNPHDFGMDGAMQISAAGVCYTVARALGGNRDLSCLSVLGALGDMQDRKGRDRALVGLNLIAVEDAKAEGLLQTGLDILVYGRESRPIHRALAYTSTPYLPDLSGREDNCLALITSIGIPIKTGDKFRTAIDLSLEEKQQILTAIIKFLPSRGVPGDAALGMIGTAYTFLNESKEHPTRDAREFSSVLNACGRMGQPSLGVSLAMGDRDVMNEVTDVVTRYRRTIATTIDWIRKNDNKIIKLDHLWAVNGGDNIMESMTGAISSIINANNLLTKDKVVIIMAKSKRGGTKMSTRAPETLLKKGIDVGAALTETTPRHQGFGGGHNVAAGAYIPSEDPASFLKDLNETLQNQLRSQVS